MPSSQLVLQGGQQGSVDVREHLALVKGSILQGCTLVFSRIFPMDLQRPEQHRLWQLALKVTAPGCTIVRHAIKDFTYLAAHGHFMNALATLYIRLQCQIADLNDLLLHQSGSSLGSLDLRVAHDAVRLEGRCKLSTCPEAAACEQWWHTCHCRVC